MRRSVSKRFSGIKHASTASIHKILYSSSKPPSQSGSRKESLDLSDGSLASTTSPPRETEVDTPETTETPETPTTPSSPSSPSNKTVPVDLWDRAEDALQNSANDGTRKVMATYLTLLEGEIGSTLAGRGTLDRQSQLSELITKRVEALEEKKWKISIGGNQMAVESLFTGIVNNVLVAKDLISSAASAEPHVALACAGISVILSLCMRSIEQQKALLTGLNYISKLICQFNVAERLYLSRNNLMSATVEHAARFANEFEDSLVKLYTEILEFQARALCHLSKHAVAKVFKDMCQVDGWDGLLTGIKESETMCRSFMGVIDSEKLHTGIEEQNSRLEGLQESTTFIASTMKEKEMQDRIAAQNELLNALYTSPYADHKDRNKERTEGTCEWFEKHPLFQGWRDKKSSGLLWVSADPGCGKSVLAKHLVDHILPSTDARTTCYFFFKDDSVKQRSSVNALCALLRQLLLQNRSLISESILDQFKTDKEKLTESFSALWRMLLEVSTDESTAEIICVLDALDECEENQRSQLTKALSTFYRNEKPKGALKFLVTSRPYVQIQREFQQLKNRQPTIHLSGESDVEVDKISGEINVVIESRVEEMGNRLTLEHEEQQFLCDELLAIPNRTYLWVTLIFDVIENSISYTNQRVRQIIRTLPRTVDEAYEKILNRSPDKRQARKLLHIVVAASKALTLTEMRIALAIDGGSHSYEDLDLESEARFPTTVRNLCGLFVTIVDSKIFLLHQTAKEFLVQTSSHAQIPEAEIQSSSGLSHYDSDCWKHSLSPMESDQVLAEICISYLMLDIFQDKSIEKPDESLPEHAFVEYSAVNWVVHFRRSQVESQMKLLKSAMLLCKHNSPQFPLWFLFHMERDSPYWGDFNSDLGSCPLLVASFLNLETIVKMIIENGKILTHAKYTFQTRSALHWASEYGHDGIVQLLLAAGTVHLNSQDFQQGRTPLLCAVSKGRTPVVRLLLQNEIVDPSIPDVYYRTPISYAAELGYEEITRLLLQKEVIDATAQDRDGKSPLLHAAGGCHFGIVKLLLCVQGVDPDSRDKSGRSPLSVAAENGDIEILDLLIKTKAVDLDQKDRLYSWTPLLWAAINDREAVVKLLVDQGTRDIEYEDYSTGQTALSFAAEKGMETVVNMLLNTGCVNPNSQSKYGRTPLSLACDNGHEKIVDRLLKTENIQPDLKDTIYGRTPLSWAAGKGHKMIVDMLLNTNAVDLDSKDKFYNRSPQEWAAARGHTEIVNVLQDAEGHLTDIAQTPTSGGDVTGPQPDWKPDYRQVKLVVSDGNPSQ